jgi:hypothetical protein
MVVKLTLIAAADFSSGKQWILDVLVMITKPLMLNYQAPMISNAKPDRRL